MNKKFFKQYFNNQINLLNFDDEVISKLEKVKKYLKLVSQKKKKVIIFGNGGSAAIANHFSVDLTKTSKIRCVNYNESSLLTCFSNDFGYENWVKKTLEYHADKGDLIILISSSGESKNMLNACKFGLKKKYFPIITLTGFKKNNSLNKLGHINFWVNSKTYNHIENTHQFLLLSLVDATKKRK
ncbi:SIS domain-containing protein [Pelagibacteraceae bacterium]|jgi:D-sedoheptulose 7-phosphate isomerase|nr:SIS domain-containing protein [Pelagibacteraceae bacterium]